MFKKILIFTIVGYLMFVCTRGVQAATLELQPAEGTANIGDTISLNLVLNVGASENVWGYEAYISFPTDLLTYNSSGFTAGNVFSIGGKTVQSSAGDKVTVGGYFDASSAGTAAGGVVATLKFSAKAAGSAVVAIICDQFTNVYAPAPSSANLFTTCATLAPKSTYVIAGTGGTGGAAATATPVPAGATVTPQPTVPVASGATPTPVVGLTQLPATGNIEDAMRLIFLGGGMLLLGIIFMLGFSRISSGSLRIIKK